MTQSDRPANGGRDDARPSERNRKRNIVDDGLRPDLVRGASFCGILEMPLIKAPKHIITPTGMVPWSRRGYDHIPDDFVCFYEMDPLFSDVLLAVDEHVEELTRFAGVISPDCSLYYEMPLAAQIANTYLNRSVGYQLQQRGLYVVPNIRWGDERTYTTCELPEKLAFLGVEKRSVVSIGTYGVSKTSREQQRICWNARILPAICTLLRGYETDASTRCRQGHLRNERIHAKPHGKADQRGHQRQLHRRQAHEPTIHLCNRPRREHRYRRAQRQRPRRRPDAPPHAHRR